ncbi:hypothetical protein MPSEU_000864200 [Mayamaea pseudoterrestris]|nr:hypothetical protein MPSEU_000864200 [Mayamaea pseudoterrestris]
MPELNKFDDVAQELTYTNEEERLQILDSMNHLKKFGFTKNSCDKCGKKNSQLDGKLIQCGKCKKAYYCSLGCFNSDLPAHHKLGCDTTELQEGSLGSIK